MTNFKINKQIRSHKIFVIDQDSSPKGEMNLFDALNLARQSNLDLVEINAKANPPVCKIMDYGKFKFEQKKKLSKQKKNQKVSLLKELTFRPNIDEHDLNHKIALAKDFLKEGHKVKFSLRFRGREITHKDIGRAKMDTILQDLNEYISGFPPINFEGKIMTMIVSPK